MNIVTTTRGSNKPYYDFKENYFIYSYKAYKVLSAHQTGPCYMAYTVPQMAI